MKETSLHNALKNWYAIPGDAQEARVASYFVDILRGDLLIEIQTRSFTAIKPKLVALLGSHPIHLIHPVALDKWIIYLEEGPQGIKRRKSPKHGRLVDIFYELIWIADLLDHPGLSLEIIFTREEEIRVHDGRGSWRRGGWSIFDRRLLEVVDNVPFNVPQDFHIFIPTDLPRPFTNNQLATALNIPPRLAGKITYCLKTINIIAPIGKRGRAYLYTDL